MKNVSLFVIFVFSIIYTKAATSITTSTVSGHWTLAGSPYLVFNNILVDNYTSLNIDPGVDVIFQGSYVLQVAGILHAAGTITQPINFYVNDTTGWSNDTTTAGGWHGIQFFSPVPAGDSSVLEYCNISDTKFDSMDWYSPIALGALNVDRTLNIINCNFFQNKSINAVNIFTVEGSLPSDIIEFSGCSFYNNSSYVMDMIRLNNFYGGAINIHDSKFYQNAASAIVRGVQVNLALQNNDFYQNSEITGVGGTGVINMTAFGGHATIKGNKIHDNVMTYDAAITCLGGDVDINGNLICNNQHSNFGGCGVLDGGGGINVGCNGCINDSTKYTIRNNVIANNYSPFHGGAISVLYADASIFNNQVINNSSDAAGCIYVLDSLPLTIKNNIFYGNTSGSNTSANSPVIEGYFTSNATVIYDHNWTEHASLFDLNQGGTYTLSGDTTKNINGTNPGLIAPTLTSAVTESAISSSFGILTTSSCYNKGDNTIVPAGSADFLGNVRIANGIVDIGAFELYASPLALGGPVAITGNEMNVFPNPATGTISISLPEAKGQLEIMDITGKKVYEQTVTGLLTAIDIHSLSRGVYFTVWNNTTVRNIKKFIAE